MNLKTLFYLLKPPCPKCPYTLGLVVCITNPCPQCKTNSYKTFHIFKSLNPARKEVSE